MKRRSFLSRIIAFLAAAFTLRFESFASQFREKLVDPIINPLGRTDLLDAAAYCMLLIEAAKTGDDTQVKEFERSALADSKRMSASIPSRTRKGPLSLRGKEYPEEMKPRVEEPTDEWRQLGRLPYREGKVEEIPLNPKFR